MKKHVLLTAFFSLVLTSAGLASYDGNYSDYAKCTGEGTTDRGCAIYNFPLPNTVCNNNYPTEDITIEYQGPHRSGRSCNERVLDEEKNEFVVSAEPAKIIFKYKNQKYAEYNGQVKNFGELRNGEIRFVNGEVWSIPNSGKPDIVIPSSSKKAELDQLNAKKKQDFAKFQKSIKPGVKASFISGVEHKQGLVTSVKGDKVKVQVTHEVINHFWKAVRPYDQWVQKNTLKYPDPEAF